MPASIRGRRVNALAATYVPTYGSELGKKGKALLASAFALEKTRSCWCNVLSVLGIPAYQQLSYVCGRFFLFGPISLRGLGMLVVLSAFGRIMTTWR